MTTRDIYSAALAARFDPGEPYRPSNASEAMAFEARWCDRCRHNEPPDADPCELPALAMLFEPGDEDFPAEWVHDDRGQPCCKAFAEKIAGPDGMPMRLVPAPGQMGFPGFEDATPAPDPP